MGDEIAQRPGGADTPVEEGQPGYQGFFEAPDGTRFFRIANGTATNPHGGKNARELYDFRNQFFKTGHFIDNTVSLSGGDREGSFYLSLGDLRQEGIIRYNSDYGRTTARVNADRRFNDFIRISTNFGYTKTTSNRVQQGSNLSGLYLGGLRTPTDFDNSYYVGTYVDPAGLRYPDRQRSYRNPLGVRENSTYDNPIWTQQLVRSTSDVDRFLGKIETVLTPAKWLDLTARVGIDNYADRRRDFFPALASVSPGGLLSLETIRETQTDVQVFGNAKVQLSKDLNLNAIVGVNFNGRRLESNAGQARNFILADNPPPLDVTNATNENKTPAFGFQQQRTAALYATATLGFRDYLFLNATGRAESASSFGRATQRTFFYPAADVAFQFTEAIPSLKNSSLLSFGKLRASYGEVGVQPAPYNTVTYYGAGQYAESWGGTLNAAAYGQGGYVESTVLGHAALRPERKKEAELGLDLRLFNDRISLGGTYFVNKTVDAILPVATAPTTGFTNKVGNAATVQNRGLELDLSGTLLSNPGLTWNVAINWTAYRNKVLSLNGTQSLFLAGFAGTSSRAVEGQPLGVLWGTDFLRNETGQVVVDANGFPQQSPQESVIGDPNPRFRSGVGNTLTYRGLSLYLLWDMQVGGQIWGGTRGALVTFGRATETGNDVQTQQDLKTYDGQEIKAGTVFRGKVQDFGAGPVALNEAWYTSLGGGFGPVGSQFIERADWQRLRELTLSYALKSAAFRRTTRLSSVELSLTGRNLLLLSPFIGNDPETNLTGTSNGRGLDYFNNPATRSVLATIRINY